MNTVDPTLPSTPLPYLLAVFTVFKRVWQTVPQAQASQEQLRALTYSLAQLLQTLDGEYRAGRATTDKTSKPLEDLYRLLTEVSALVKDATRKTFLRSIFLKNDRITRIEEFYLKVGHIITEFQMSALFKMDEWESRNEQGQAKDEQQLADRLNDLDANQDRLMEVLGIHKGNMTAIMICLRKRLDSQLDEKRVRQFFQRTLEYLTARNGFEVEIETWTITSYEIEYGHRIGVGGFGEVYKGVWNKTPVAIKVLKSKSGITPSPTAIRREIETWSALRHTHILQFLGANELDDKPFIVMPYLKHGNARDYIRTHPSCHRLQIVYGVSLGLVYLHSQGIVHGDLKALNVLIDDAGNAVLCDFGLSRMMADTTSQSGTGEGGYIVGSWNWMAPERLLGGLLKKPSDIYALGMTIYEIFVDDIPLSGINHGDEFIELVARQDVRPTRPSDEDAPSLSTAIWELAEKCWVKDAKKRPIASAVCDTVSRLLESGVISPPALSPASPSITHRIRLLPHMDSLRTFHFDPITRDLKEGGKALSIGRFTSAAGQLSHRHVIQFKSLVVSRSHAKLWFEAGGKLFIRDMKSSTGTFLNDVRLSPRNTESRSHQVNDGDILRLGEDYPDPHEKPEIHNSVKIRVELEGNNNGVAVH